MLEKNDFDSVSSYYDWLVRLVFGKSMMQAQTLFLNRIHASSTVLVLGGGTGLWLNELLNAVPTCRIVYIDSSAKMIDRALKNANNSNNIDFRCGDENTIPGDFHFDIVILYCYLDLFPDSQLANVIAKIRNATAKSSKWIVVDFMCSSWWHKVMLFIMYNFFNFTTGLATRKLPKWERTLNQSNLQQVNEKLFYHGFIKSAVFIGRDV